MSVKDGLLALLRTGPKHGYQLKVEFDEAAGDTWHLNFGQVYTTLQRLQRDGLVLEIETDIEGRTTYGLTESGSVAAGQWFTTPVERTVDNRDEVSLKLLIAMKDPGVEIGEVLRVQRVNTMKALQDFNALRAARPEEDVRWTMHLDRLVFLAEAELRWIERTEERLRVLAEQRGVADAVATAERQPSL
ncbi:MAG: helix-turn-helix transcriptional regulator [Acidimicrobiia bacterium]|nr:helix-turn-helix transcriptional regulator [Acidimicrobiia bacterium]